MSGQAHAESADLKAHCKVGVKAMSQGTVEILVGRERRRRWDLREKLRIVAESEEPGASVRAVAARHDVYPSLLHTWRRHARSGRLGTPGPTSFVPVQMVEMSPTDRAGPIPTPDRRQAGVIEIILPDGNRVRVGSDVSLTALRRVITVLRG